MVSDVLVREQEFTGVAQTDMRTPRGLEQCAAVIRTLLQPGLRAEVCLKTCRGRGGSLLCRVFATTVLSSPQVVELGQGAGRAGGAGGKRKRQAPSSSA
jgi:hypothetical protein